MSRGAGRATGAGDAASAAAAARRPRRRTLLGVRAPDELGGAPAADHALPDAPPVVGQGHTGGAKGSLVSAPPRAHPRSSGQTTVGADVILPSILAPLTRGDGIRVGWLGNTGQGKTFAAAWLVDEARVRNLVDVILVVDDKGGGPPVYAGTQRVNPADLGARPPGPDDDPCAVIYRGAAADPSQSVDVETVARQAWELALLPGRPRVLVVVDELRRAVSPAGREWRAPTVARTLGEGRAVGISMLWATQSPQRIPVEAFDQSLLCIFHLGHRGRAYLERADLISVEVSAVVAALEPRQFVVVDDAGDWDGKVYEVPLRRP